MANKKNVPRGTMVMHLGNGKTAYGTIMTRCGIPAITLDELSNPVRSFVTSCVQPQRRRKRTVGYWKNPNRMWSKYNAKKVKVDGITFDSQKEAHRYRELKLLARAGEISDLQLQVPYELQPSFKHNGKTIRAIKYVADFTYKDKDGKIHIEDAKGMKTKEYLIKRKMLLYVHGIEIEEV